MKNFFRGDLQLRSKWWHRVAVSVYFVASALFIVSSGVALYSAHNRPLNIKDLDPSEYTIVNQGVGISPQTAPENNTHLVNGFIDPRVRAPINHLAFGLFIFLLALVLYNKVVLYVIFGNKK